MLKFLKNIFEIFFPQFCVLCGNKISCYMPFPLCYDCQKSLQPITEPICKKCGRPLISEQDFCMECRTTYYEFDCCSAVYQYKSLIHNVIVSYKGKNIKKLAYFFADILYEQLHKKNWHGFPVVPIPPRKGKIKRTGWDQIALITDILNRKYKLPVFSLLERKKTVIEQKKLNKNDRKLIIKGQFSIKKQSMYIPPTVVLLDDITTTCATLNECARVLKQHGCQKIYSLVLAID